MVRLIIAQQCQGRSCHIAEEGKAYGPFYIRGHKQMTPGGVVQRQIRRPRWRSCQRARPLCVCYHSLNPYRGRGFQGERGASSATFVGREVQPWSRVVHTMLPHVREPFLHVKKRVKKIFKIPRNSSSVVSKEPVAADTPMSTE